ncbi:hypothetical protein Tco_1531567, partial [Tanacetum coccineum]
TQRSVKDKTGLGLNEYTAVPPPPAQVYSPPKNDLSWTAILMRSGRKTINAAKPKAVHNAVKASACWVWKPKNRIQVCDGLGSHKKMIWRIPSPNRGGKMLINEGSPLFKEDAPTRGMNGIQGEAFWHCKDMQQIALDNGSKEAQGTLGNV